MNIKIILYAVILANICSCDNAHNSNAIIVLPWHATSDSISYIEDASKFNEIWKKLDSGLTADVACGYTYSLNRVDSSGNIQSLASINSDCGVVATDSLTFINKSEIIREFEKLMKSGYQKLDTIENIKEANEKIRKYRDNPNFIGASQADTQHWHSFMTKNKTENESTDNFDSLQMAYLYKSSKRQLHECKDNNGKLQICGILPEEFLKKIQELGYNIDSKKALTTFPTYWKR